MNLTRRKLNGSLGRSGGEVTPRRQKCRCLLDIRTRLYTLSCRGGYDGYMKLTKYTHSCVRVDNEGHALVIDPGNFAPEGEHAAALDGAEYLLITHAHPDHFDAERVLPLIAQRPQLRMWAPATVAQLITEAVPDAQVTAIEADSVLDVPGFEIKTFGGQHALIHPLIPMLANIGYLINGSVYHPGDSLVVPHGVKAPVLLAPIHAPWGKIQEVIDFVIAVGAERVHPIHNGMINERGTAIIENLVTMFGAKYGSAFEHLEVGQSVEL